MVKEETRKLVEEAAAKMNAAGKSYVVIAGTEREFPMGATGGKANFVGWLLGFATTEHSLFYKSESEKEYSSFVNGYASGMKQAFDDK